MSQKPTLAQLPPELVSEIFAITVQSYGTLLPTGFIPSIRLTQICRRWRQLAIANPILWTALSLRGTGLTLENEADGINEYLIQEHDTLILSESLLKRDCNALSMFLERSKNLPLALRLGEGYPYGEPVEETEYGQLLRNTLAPSLSEFVARSETVFLRTAGDSIPLESMRTMITMALNATGKLRELFIGAAWIVEDGLREDAFSKLTSLETRDIMPLITIRDALTPLSLQTLVVEFDIEWDVVLDVIRSCPNLSLLSVAPLLPTGSADNDDDAVLLPNLRELKLGIEPDGAPDQSPLQILQCIQAPMIAKLRIEWDTEPGETCVSSLVEFLSRTPSVIDLQLHDAEFSEGDFTAILESVPQVKAFQFNSSELASSGIHPLISLLSSRSPDPVISSSSLKTTVHPQYCPEMESFAFTTTRKGSGNRATMDSIVSFLGSRTGIESHPGEDGSGHHAAKDPTECGDTGNAKNSLKRATFKIGIAPEHTLPYVGAYDIFVRAGVILDIELL